MGTRVGKEGGSVTGNIFDINAVAKAKGDIYRVACQCPHCDPVGWLPLVERGKALDGWVRRGNVVWSHDERVERMVFVLPEIPAPMPDGFSWLNLSLAYGWLDRASEGEQCECILRRVLDGRKVGGSLIATSQAHTPAARTWPTVKSVRRRVAASPGFTLVETPVASEDPEFEHLRLCWVAPAHRLGTVVPISEIACWWAQLGCGDAGSQVFGAGDLWLPDLAESFDLLPFAVTGLVLGYPPASTASIVALRVCPSCQDTLTSHCNCQHLRENGIALERCEVCGATCRSLGDIDGRTLRGRAS
jgi:hypothetical protein